MACAQSPTGVRDQAQVQRDAAAFQRQGVQAAAAVDARQLRHVAAGAKSRLQGSDVVGVDHDSVVACAAVQHVCSATADQRVVAAGADQGIGACGAHLVHRTHSDCSGGRAKDHIAAPGVRRVNGSVGQIGAHDQVGQTVSVDVAGRCDADAAAVTRTLAVDHEASFAFGYLGERDRRGHSRAVHHIAATGIVAPEA